VAAGEAIYVKSSVKVLMQHGVNGVAVDCLSKSNLTCRCSSFTGTKPYA
jgi:hypothetical protein